MFTEKSLNLKDYIRIIDTKNLPLLTTAKGSKTTGIITIIS
jgi:hypothetical protein